MWNLENGTDELVCRAEIETHVENKTCGHQGGKVAGGGGVLNWEIGIDMYTLMCIKWMPNNL